MISGEINYYFKEVETKEEFLRYFNIRYKVYCEQKKWLRSNKYPDKLEMDAYDDSAKHFIVLNDDFEIIGCVRFLFGKNHDRLPFQNHPGVRNKKIDISSYIELSRLILISQKNNFAILKGLNRVAYKVAKSNDVENWVMLAEPSMVKLLARLRHYFRPLCQPSMYFGAFTYPALCNLTENDAILKRKFPKEYQYFNDDYSVITIPAPAKRLVYE